MKILLREDQQHVFKDLVEIIKVLATVDGQEATDAIKCAWRLADNIGVQSDLDRLAANADSVQDYKQWTWLFGLKRIVEKRSE